MADKKVNEATANEQKSSYTVIGHEDRKLTDLKSHPRNEEIYGRDEDVSDLVGLIKESGRIENPIIINQKNVIISGHRRWLAAQSEELKSVLNGVVPCEIRKYTNPKAELEALILFNVGREKTNEQRIREGMELEEIISERSKERRKAGLIQYQTDMGTLPTTGDSPADGKTTKGKKAKNPDIEEEGATRDIVAKAVKIPSGSKYARQKAVVKEIDRLKQEKKTEDSEILLYLLNKRPNVAHQLVKNGVLDKLSPEDKQKLKSGEVSPRLFVSKEKKEKDTKSPTPLKAATTEVDVISKSVTNLMGLVLEKISDKDKKKICDKIGLQVSLLINVMEELGWDPKK